MLCTGCLIGMLLEFAEMEAKLLASHTVCAWVTSEIQYSSHEVSKILQDQVEAGAEKDQLT